MRRNKRSFTKRENDKKASKNQETPDSTQKKRVSRGEGASAGRGRKSALADLELAIGKAENRFFFYKKLENKFKRENKKSFFKK
ncbi:hypothetical protein IQB76_19660 [Leptospira borgpetersenii serovar Hardjo-bovis]|uniref:hypothetical protein n=1 Tax=Leptospira borgpetersenii TaxID=174 RepID=UPI00188285B4|nr:hypothetical protein [Leptospira borgpetersenii]MBE8398295.1 hypothetical protein [Leptospira borgpetersenii serovar Hardjo-bovis]